MLHEACRGNHDECLTLLLPYVETTQMGFGILLSECVHADHVAFTEVLLQHWKSACNNVAFVPEDPTRRAKKSAYDAYMDCPAMWSDPAVCRVLIDAGADLQTKNEKRLSPLHYACKRAPLNVVKMLVEAGAGVRATNDEDCTCLHIPAEYADTEIVRYLVGLPDVGLNDRQANNYTALHLAVESEDTDVVQVLIDAGADLDTQIDDGSPPLDDASGQPSPLHSACYFGELEVVKMFIRAGVGVCATRDGGDTCLTVAASQGHTETVRYLLCLPEVDVNRRANNCSALHLAVFEKYAELVQVLSEAGADIDTQNDYGCSPLHSACRSGALDFVKILVRAGAGVRATDDEGCTCLMLAARCGHTETVRYLVGLPELDVNHRDAENHTALHLAVIQNHKDVLQLLIDVLYLELEAEKSRTSRM